MNMIFATVCIGEDRRSDTMHLLNDLRNLDCNVFVLTNINLHLDHFQFSNVIEKKIETSFWTDFQRFEIIKIAFEETKSDYVYYLDCDSRFIDFRIEKFNIQKFEKKISEIDFDVLCPLFLSQAKNQLEKPIEDEDKNKRGFTFGYEEVINFFKKNNNSYELDLNNQAPLETVLIFKRSENMQLYLSKLIDFSKILILEEIKNNRKQIAPACGFAMTMLKNVFNIKIVESPAVYHFFKGNFLKEVFPFNFKININEKLFD